MTDTSINDNFYPTIKNLVELLDISPEDTENALPTYYAFATALKSVIHAYEQMGDSFPPAWAITDDSGGIQLNWNRHNHLRTVCLFCPPSNEQVPYVYYSQTIEYPIEDILYDSALTGWLDWSNEYNE